MNGVGQTIPMEQTMIIVVGRDGQAHGWNVTDGTASWEWTGIGGTGRSTAKIEITGELHRRSQQIPESILKELQ